MSLSLDTVLQVIEIVNKAVEVYQRIQDAPEQMRRIGKRMERLRSLLGHLEQLLRREEKRALARLRPAQTEDLLAIMEDIRDDSAKVDALFHKWDNDIGPFGFQFRFKTIAQAYFALGSSSEKLSSIADDIELHRQDLRDYLQLMGCVGINELLVAGPANSAPKAGARPSPSPATPLRTDYKIIFIDPHNVARSVACEALTKLLREWTVRTGGDWRIKLIHSAGFFVKSRSEVTDIIDGLKYTYPSYKMGLSEGNAKPKAVASAAVFDNKLYDYPYKKAIQEEISARRSRGLSKDVFKTYDYIIVFTSREHDNMVKLRKALTARDGKEAAPKGMGRVLHLGHYLTLDGIPREIVDAPKNKDGTESRDNWNWKVSQMKTAIKGFLKQEMRWTQPPQTGKVS
ncbi:hypothetical protein UCRPA7_5629 [Phaeoacremonium minimum UCRPA7]|uniref:Uncharacterized protein n=1 Tax=Phaeoacremonium minimum (strain UCR-PA7) TaxID=1286976 RepID=R8BHN3_PHAM7|nr:hypothetical protein UCRPA7_5629 [Phaeoacremonium minimum UCRPA7]EON98835.1 hypothetical protein UCRPA7_5629 [Phaeoacremonium minimum UCRPA7]